MGNKLGEGTLPDWFVIISGVVLLMIGVTIGKFMG